MLRWLIRVFVLLLVLAGVAGVGAGWYIRTHTPFSSRAEPTRFEAAGARRVRHLSIPADLRARANPLPASADNLHEGMEHFADHCAICHANSGAGDTPVG